DKMQSITSNIMDYMSGVDRQLLREDHGTELMYNIAAHPTPAIFGPGTPFAFAMNTALGYLVADSDCGNYDIRGNWILINPVTGRKVGVSSTDTEGQDIRLFSYAFAKIALNLTGSPQYLLRGIHHQSIDHSGDSYFCLSKHDYFIPLTKVSTAWSLLENMPSVPEDLVFTFGPSFIGGQLSKPLGVKLSSFPRNFYIFEYLGSTSATWTHANVNKFADFYGHENIDLIYSCLNNESPLKSKQHYIDLLSKMPCDGPRNYGPTDFTSFWNSANNFEEPHYDDISTESYNYGEYNANDWMWLYNMYRLKFGDSTFPKYEDLSCNCKKSPMLELNTNPQTGVLNTSITLKRVFKDYLALGISFKEFNQGTFYIQNNKTLTNETEFTVCGQVNVSGNGSLINAGKPTNADSIKVIVRNNAGLFIQNSGTLDIGNNTKAIIQKGGQLFSTGINSKIIVRDGGKLIIEPGAFFELNNGSKLIVENGGHVIIQTKIFSDGSTSDNAILTYNQGAEIQLKGDDAVLELNGRLHIGDNATFKITYPGSNSGYIKFNRGQGVWWDNWAPNNAHITCGTNARINLQGQSKTDKLIDISQVNVAIPKNLTQILLNNCQIEYNVERARLETDRPTIITNSTLKSNYFPTSGNGGELPRGLLVFGQPNCIISGCDFKNFGSGIIGALFYGGTKLSGVKNCNFYRSGITTYGGGAAISNNNFYGGAIQVLDATLNSFISKNILTSYLNNNPDYQEGFAMVIDGSNVEFDVKENTINNMEYGIGTSYCNLKLRCNDMQNNQLALFAIANSKINMSNDLGGGYNNANNCEEFAKFRETSSFEANNGYNNFNIKNGGPCQWIPPSGHGPSFTPGYWKCPTITEGSLMQFTSQNPVSGDYEIFAENNFWRSLVSASDVVEDNQNKIRKIDLTDPYYPIYDSASLLTGNVLASVGPIVCPPVAAGCVGPACRTNNMVHPLNDNSNSSVITTSSFYNKKLQKALQFSLSKMDAMHNVAKVNEVTDLFTEILKYNYSSPVNNPVDKYLLELAYQKLFICVAHLAELHRDTAVKFNPMPISLQSRFNDLHLICALRTGRKDITERDFKEVSDLILLDKAMIYRISDHHQNALTIVNAIIANNPKASHLDMYQNFQCLWNVEMEAINGNISIDEAIERLDKCKMNFNSIKTNVNASRSISLK
ncbi:MAG: hypothetical protein K0R94_1337, partial [Burkholderiales bacterium]|nr:hypothetical protein [Burkholderiales bacterium]